MIANEISLHSQPNEKEKKDYHTVFINEQNKLHIHDIVSYNRPKY